MIIGICGLIGSGKGTVADILVDYHDFKKISFADKVKDGVAAVFGWDRALLEGDTDRSRLWREKVDEYWTKETGREITPRLVLQEFGTDCMRMGFYDAIWVSLVKKHMVDNPHYNYVIPDVRFPNEMSMIRELGGQVWQVRRGELPVWWATAQSVNKNWDTCKDTNHSMATVFPDVHQSEWRWVDNDNQFEHILTNNDTLEALYSQVEQTLST